MALESAAARARRVIHDNDVEGLKRLLADSPALLSWRASESDARIEGATGGLLGIATSAFGDSFDSGREKTFTRAACAELLIDAGAVVVPSVYEGFIVSRTRGLLQLFERKGLLPRTLRFLSALGDRDAVRASLDEHDSDLAAVNDALMVACRFEHETVASLLLDRAIALDAELGQRVDESGGRLAFVGYLIKERALDFVNASPAGPWQTLVMERVMRAVHDGDSTAFVRGLQREPWLLGENGVGFQIGIIERATLRDRGEFIAALLALEPALLGRQPPPRSEAIGIALTYAKPHLIPSLTRIWPMPDDLPHAAGTGNLSRVKNWFDESGAPALGDLNHHFPCNNVRARTMLQWGAPAAQQVLDTALAWSVINRHFDVADFMLEHGADINTTWNSHEPASILHHLVFDGSYDSMTFLIDRGIDMTIRDYRWNSTAQGWARYGGSDEKMAEWLAEAEHQRELKR